MDDISIKINDDVNKIEIDVDKIDVDKNDDKIFTFNDINDEPHNDDKIDIIDMNNNDKKIALSFDRRIYPVYFTFNLKDEFILYSSVHSYFGNQKIIWIYSTQTKNNKWECKRFYRIPEDYEVISISKYDKVYLYSIDYIYEWNINTEKSVKIFVNNEDKNE
ncbi:hypothetical protein RhiirC2_871835, partial [Rhizophagus irregularis]